MMKKKKSQAPSWITKENITCSVEGDMENKMGMYKQQ